MRGSDGLAAALGHRRVRVLRRLPGGHRNAVFLVERNGQRLVAKTTRHSEASLRWLQPVFRVAASVGLNPPELLPDDDGRLAPGGVTLEAFVRGRPAVEGELCALAPRLAALHGRLAALPPRPTPPRTKSPPAMEEALARAVDALPRRRLTIIHGDLTPSNLLIGADGPALIDWDEARRDHPAFDLPLDNPPRPVARARLLWEIASGWRLEPHHTRALARKHRALNFNPPSSV